MAPDPTLSCNPLVRRIVRLAIEEDLGTGDVTTESLIEPGMSAVADITVKADGVVAGIPVAIMVFQEVSRDVVCTPLVADGSRVTPGTVVMRASGPAAALLVAERTVLDFLMRLSGVATRVRTFADALSGTATRILDTRKTTPGLRVLEKYAVRLGGGHNHRMGLAGGVLVKNNHLAVEDDLGSLVRMARERAPVLSRIEVEVRSLQEARAAVDAGADMLLLDHMNDIEVTAVVALCRGRCKTEASGDMTLTSAIRMAELGVDFVSAGSLTRDAAWLDFGMYIRRA